MSKIIDITTKKVSLIVLAGDLSKFSSAYASGSAPIVEEFIRRFYILCYYVISAGSGRLVKFTGDGFFAVWPFSDDFRRNSKVCQMVERLAITLSDFVNLARLDLKMNNEVFLKQGIAIEPNALHISYERFSGATENDYIGKMINCAFRIMSLPDSYPYIAAHKEFIEVMNMYVPRNSFNSYKKLEVDEDTINHVFKGVRA
jgi:class 3 adenylate cyclase